MSGCSHLRRVLVIGNRGVCAGPITCRQEPKRQRGLFTATESWHLRLSAAIDRS
jgi:hypothetical protein